MPDFDDPSAEDVEKFPVVRNCQNRARISQQVVLKPSERFEIEVVRRLIEKKQIRLLDQKPREMRAHNPSAAQLLHRPLKILFPKSQPRQNPLRCRLRAAISLFPRGKFHDRAVG